MANGIIQDKMSRPEGEDVGLDTIQSNIQMPPELQDAYTRVVIAGMKLMFSKETHKLMLQELDKKGPIGQKLGKGIAGLMLILFQESNATMPPQVILPAGIELMSQAVDFLRKGNLAKVNNQDFAEGVETYIMMMLDKFGIQPDKVQALLGQYSNEGIQGAGGAQPQPPTQPPAEQAQAPAQPPVGA